MSDALSEIYRDQQRATAFEAYLLAICTWAENGMTDEGKGSVRKAAEDTDLIRGGYWGSGTTIAKRIDDRLSKLAAADLVEWAKLIRASEDEWHYDINQRIVKASPFAGKSVAFVEYGSGFIRSQGTLDALISKAIKAKGFSTHDCEKYALVLPDDLFAGAEIIQVFSGYKTQK